MTLALAISPHLDDAVFSCGGTLARLADAGWDVVVATMFTASVPSPTGFALACQLDKGLSAEADYMALRRAEDTAACGVLRARTAWLPFREAPHRGYHSAAALFGDTLSRDQVHLELAGAIAGLVARHRPTLLFAPQGIGGHVDHVLTIRALHLLRHAGPTLWWRDFPYIARTAAPREPFADAMATLPERAVSIDAARKRDACAAYATQLGFQFGGVDGLARALEQAGHVESFRASGTVALPPSLAAAA